MISTIADAVLKSEILQDQFRTSDYIARIGGDEFALITGSKDLSYVEDLSREVLSHNGEYFSWENQKIPLSLRAGIHQVPENNLKYDDFYSGMHKAIEECRRQEQIVKKV